ncbi:MAG TPA: GNAT family N-acetyltransferase [Propionibacterium sp.]|nr:GNAT family N-acetyltransferase [Propionibacterium sp.]
MTHQLRPWHPEDAQEMFDAASDPEIARQLPPFETEADARAYIAKSAGSDDVVAYAISDDSEKVLGGVMARLNRPMRTAWVSYWLVAEARGKGLASRATVALANRLFDEDVHRLELGHRLNNPDSRKVADRAGFIQEGIMREELEYDGVRYDTALMSRLASDPVPDTEPLPGLE